MIESDSNSRHLWRTACFAIAFVVVTAVFFVVTKGPVYRWRVVRGPLTEDFLDDGWTQTVFCGVYAVALTALVPSIRSLTRERTTAMIMMAPAIVLVVVSIWSPHPDRALQQAMMMFLGTAAAIVIGATTKPITMIWAVWTAMYIGLGLSLVADHQNWAFSRGLDGSLVGVYFNKNSFGAVAVMALLASIGLIGAAIDARPSGDRSRLRLVAGAATAPLAAVLAVRARSLTPLVGLVVAMVVSIAVFAYNEHQRGVSVAERANGSRTGRAKYAMMTAAAVAALASVVVGVRRAGQVSTVADRIEIWDAVIGFIAKRPLVGWGLMAAWLEDDMSARIQLDGGRIIHEAHNGFLELTLGGGAIALAAVLAAVVVALRATQSAYVRKPEFVNLWLVAGATYAVAVNIGETYLGANLLPWVLLVAAAVSASGVGFTSAEPPAEAP